MLQKKKKKEKEKKKSFSRIKTKFWQILINIFISEWKYKQEILIFFPPPLLVYATVMSLGSALFKSLTTACSFL